MPSAPTPDLLLEFLGAVVRRLDDWAAVGTLVALLGEAGADEPGVRTALSRLKKRGWVEPERRDGQPGYRLTPTAAAGFAAGDQVIWHARQPADLSEGWVIVAFSIPEPRRADRHQLKTRLGALGFGHIGPGMLLAPERLAAEAERVVAELDLAAHADLFTAHYRSHDLAGLVARGWDLDALADGYRDFTRALSPVLARAGGRSSSEAFSDYLHALHAWRPLRFRDPGLPRELLAEDWPGVEARALFDRLVSALEPRAVAHAAAQWPEGAAVLPREAVFR